MPGPPTSSLWHDSLPAADWAGDRGPLTADTEADVVIVGGGYTGLWTAYYLAQRRPSWRILVLEAEVVGFGASGRNGGWCSALLPMSLATIAASDGRDAARRAQMAMDRTVDEVARVVAAEGIDCDFTRGGSLRVARSTVQAERVRTEVAEHHSFGFGDDDVRWLDADEARARIGTTATFGAAFTRQCAAVHPAKLARGLGHVVERRGVVIHEGTRVEQIERGRVRAGGHRVKTRLVVRATEAFTTDLPGLHRALAPILSSMIATEPLPADVLDAIGLAERATFTDARRLVIYGQRTADGRIAFGGRGAPYRFGSRLGDDLDGRVHERLRTTLVELFPALDEVDITHRWGGAVAAARDWWWSVGMDRGNGIAWAGGYVGDGVATANLAGRTLAELLCDEPGPLSSLPWVGHSSRHWEVEPLRWLGINAVVRLTDRADRYEARTGKPDRWRGALIDRVTSR